MLAPLSWSPVALNYNFHGPLRPICWTPTPSVMVFRDVIWAITRLNDIMRAGPS